MEQLQQTIREQRQQIKQVHDELHTRRSESHSIKGKITSLELLQQHAMGKDNKHLAAWLASVNIADNRRLAEFLDVEPGWDSAVETVLGAYLEAICIDSADSLIPVLSDLKDESLTLFETGIEEAENKASLNPLSPTLSLREREHKIALSIPVSIMPLPLDKSNTHTAILLDKVSAPWDLSDLLTGVLCAENHEAARALSAGLKPWQSVITPDGAWFGPGWVRIIRAKDSKTGVLQREKELRLLKQRQIDLQEEITELEDRQEKLRSSLKRSGKVVASLCSNRITGSVLNYR